MWVCNRYHGTQQVASCAEGTGDTGTVLQYSCFKTTKQENRESPRFRAYKSRKCVKTRKWTTGHDCLPRDILIPVRSKLISNVPRGTRGIRMTRGRHGRWSTSGVLRTSGIMRCAESRRFPILLLGTLQAAPCTCCKLVYAYGMAVPNMYTAVPRYFTYGVQLHRCTLGLHHGTRVTKFSTCT
jgi:hypothetical protein